MWWKQHKWKVIPNSIRSSFVISGSGVGGGGIVTAPSTDMALIARSLRSLSSLTNRWSGLS